MDTKLLSFCLILALTGFAKGQCDYPSLTTCSMTFTSVSTSSPSPTLEELCRAFAGLKSCFSGLNGCNTEVQGLVLNIEGELDKNGLSCENVSTAETTVAAPTTEPEPTTEPLSQPTTEPNQERTSQVPQPTTEDAYDQCKLSDIVDCSNSFLASLKQPEDLCKSAQAFLGCLNSLPQCYDTPAFTKASDTLQIAKVFDTCPDLNPYPVSSRSTKSTMFVLWSALSLLAILVIK